MLIRTIYVLCLPLLAGLAWAAAIAHPKLRAGLLRRIGWRGRLRKAMARRKRELPLVWFHAASAGELLQAEPVMRRFQERGAQLALSLTSVSGLPWLERLEDWPALVWADLLPFDFPWNTGLLLEELRPAALVHIQAELWPGLVFAAHGRGIPQALIAARIGSGVNYRARFPFRLLYRALYGKLDAILCSRERDWAGISRIVPGHPRLEMAGDPGIETVLARLGEAAPPTLPESWAGQGAQVLVIGSSWPEDEALLLPAVREACADHPELRVILAPHEPKESVLNRLEEELSQLGTVRLGAVQAGAVRLSHAAQAAPTGQEGGAARAGQTAQDPRVVLVDGVGRLAGLYRLGSMAYVGGGFGTGVHNVAEPAACGLPVCFGPSHGNSAVAAELLAAGAAIAVKNGEELHEALRSLIADEAHRIELGHKGRAIVRGMAGAAERTFEAVSGLVPEFRDG